MRKVRSVFLLFILITLSVEAQQQPVPAATNSDTAKFNRLVAYLTARYLPAPATAAAEVAVSRAVVNTLNESRNDQQLGAVPGAAGSTTLTERAGIPDLLSIAIERGAITKTTDGSSVTLSTTPYAWLTAFGMRDSTANWQSNSWARRIALSSTFASEDVVTDGDFSSFSSGQVKIVLMGNRSARDMSPAVFQAATASLNAAVAAADHALVETCSSQLHNIIPVGQLTQALQAMPGAQSGDRAALDPIFQGVTLSEAGLAVLRQCRTSVDMMADAEKLAIEQLGAIAAAYLADANRVQLSVAGIFQRDPTISDYYTIKVLSDWRMRAGNRSSGASAATANLNAQVDFNVNQHATNGDELDTVRSFSAELAAMTARFANRRLDGTLSAKVTRPKGDDAKTTAIGQAKLNVYLSGTFTLPIALSYANRENETVKRGFQFNVGVSALLDRLLTNELAR